MIKGIDFETFIKNDVIYFSSINEGFLKYNYIHLKGDFENLKNFLLEILKNTEFYFDFYYPNLDKDSKENFDKHINNDKNILTYFDFQYNSIYFSSKSLILSKNILEFIINISVNEILFSNFYLLNPKITIWTNYNNEILLFYDNFLPQLIMLNIDKFNLKILNI